MYLARLLLAACAALGLALSAGAANWPRFRGPNGSGAADDKDIPVQWAEKDIVWKVTLPGVGNSSPIVWGDRLFIQSASTDGKERYLLCLNTSDGKEVWKRSVGGARAKMNAKNSLASSTPATDGERVYAYFWDGESVALHAFDFKGEPLWKYDIGKFSSDHGAGASPMVYAGKVVLLNDQGEGGSVIALDGKTGQRAWVAKREHFQNRACYATPFVLERRGQPAELIVASTMGVTGYDPETGAENWQYELTFPGRPLRVVSSPFPAEGGLVVVSCGDGSGERKTFAIRPGGKDGTRPSLAWDSTKAKEMPYVPGFLSRGEHLYWVNDYGFAGCTAAKTGEILWKKQLTSRETIGFSSSPVLVGDKVYAADEAGDVFVFAAEPAFRLLAKNRLGDKVMATPAVADGRLFIRGDNHLYCIGKEK
jgi:outer membrane protein assembly factor BamB